MFLKNADMCTPSSKSLSAGEEALRREHDAEKYGLAVLHEQLEELKKKTKAKEEALERIARLYEELKKEQEESNLILMKILNMNTPGISPQT